MVFCRERGWKEELDPVEAREGVCNITDILANLAGDDEVSRMADAWPDGNDCRIEATPTEMSVVVLSI